MPEQGTVLVLDSVTGKNVRMHNIDAANAVAKFPARFSFVDLDPSPTVFKAILSPGERPKITGSKGANAALASLITSLATLGVVIDNTT